MRTVRLTMAQALVRAPVARPAVVDGSTPSPSLSGHDGFELDSRP